MLHLLLMQQMRFFKSQTISAEIITDIIYKKKME
jgi:hypothetical protein